MLHVPTSLIPPLGNASPPPKRSARASVVLIDNPGTTESLVNDAAASIPQTPNTPSTPAASKEAAAAPAEEEEAALEGAAQGDDDVIEVELTADVLERTKTLRQLKDMCTERGLVNTGKKSELAARLLT